MSESVKAAILILITIFFFLAIIGLSMKVNNLEDKVDVLYKRINQNNMEIFLNGYTTAEKDLKLRNEK